MTSFELIMRDGVNPASAPNKPPLPPRDYARWEEDGLLIERNVEVTMRDGVSVSRRTRRDGVTRMSSITSPMTTTRLILPSPAGGGGHPAVGTALRPPSSGARCV